MTKKIVLSDEQKVDCLCNLKKYLYEDLSDPIFESTKIEIINIALNYIFNGKLEKNNNDWETKYKTNVRELVKGKFVISQQKYSFNFSTLEQETRIAWKTIKEEIEKHKKARVNKPIEKTIVFEAPPFHLEKIIGGEKEKFVYHPNFFILSSNAEGYYVDFIRNALSPKSKTKTISDILIERNYDFFDIFPVPLPINFKLREKWLNDGNFTINDKNIIVHLFEWALIDYYIRNKTNLCKLIDHKFAIGIQIASSTALYDYYTKTHCLVSENDEYSVIPFEEIKLDVQTLILTFNICTENVISKRPKGKWLQPYKTCIIGGNNYPDAFLLQNAFDINL